MIKTVQLVTNQFPKYLQADEISGFLDNPQGFVWVNLENTNPDEIKNILEDTFHFHPLTIEDCLSLGYQTPKVDDFIDYIFMIANTIAPDGAMKEIETFELDLFLGQNFLVTCYTDDKISAIETVWNRLEKDERMASRGADFLCHAILDTVVDEYMPLLDNMDEEIESLEDQVLSNPEKETLERLLTLKHSVMSLRRVISPLRELINRLSRDEFPQIGTMSRIYFRDVYDHLVRIQELSESIRDIVSGAVDIYLNSTSLRLNVVMKALTIVSTIFLPLTFLAGVYGMNFKYFPELNWTFGYPALWGIFLIIVIAMLAFFRKRGWF